MDKQSTVVFRNVGQLYFPQTRVECHYSLSSDHQWSSSDWIGIFEMNWSSVKQYYTYTWALVPEDYTEGTSVNFCALFQASYLPRPSTVEYQFVYVDKMGEVCARSRPFTFCAPKPLEELETLKEEQEEEDGEEELLLVIPRAQLLQSRLEECLKKQGDLQRALDAAKRETENEKEDRKKVRMDWEFEREAMKAEITELRDNLRHDREMLKNMEGKHKDVKYNQANLNSELSKLMTEKAESQQQIKDLQDDIRVLTNREKEGNNELERLKERVKKMSSQMKHDEEKRKSLQRGRTTEDCVYISMSLQNFRTRPALFLRLRLFKRWCTDWQEESDAKSNMSPPSVENEAAVVELQGLQERLETSEHAAESLRRELREMGTRQGNTHAELHQARLQVAQLTLLLSEENLVLREERANWALEREAYKHAAESDKKKLQDLSCEVQRKEEWLHEERTEREKLEVELGKEKHDNKVLLTELQELKASLRKIQKEREEEQLYKQDLVSCIHQLEQRLGTMPEARSNIIVSTCISSDSSSEDDQEESSASLRSVCEDSPASDTQEDRRQGCETRDDEGKKLILKDLVNPILSDLADAPMW